MQSAFALIHDRRCWSKPLPDARVAVALDELHLVHHYRYVVRDAGLDLGPPDVQHITKRAMAGHQ